MCDWSYSYYYSNLYILLTLILLDANYHILHDLCPIIWKFSFLLVSTSNSIDGFAFFLFSTLYCDRDRGNGFHYFRYEWTKIKKLRYRNTLRPIVLGSYNFEGKHKEIEFIGC